MVTTVHSAPRIPQLWGQFTVAFVKEGDESHLPTEIQKVAWDNATIFKREFHPWWSPIHFTYNCTKSKAKIFVLTICSAFYILHTQSLCQD